MVSVTPDARNANKGTQRGRGLLEKSLRQYGAGRSVLTDKHGTLIAGNKTHEVATEIGLPVRIIDTDGHELVVVRRTDLDLSTDKAAVELGIADNRVGEVSLDWDAEILAALGESVDLNEWWSEDELAELLGNATPVADDPGAQVDRADELRQKWGVSRGDLWQVGRHRLLCGDSTSAEDVARLMAGERAAVMLTDPPYGTTSCAWDVVIPFDTLWSLCRDYASGVAILTSSQPFTTSLIASNFDAFRHCWVWNKRLAGNFMLAQSQPLKIHEDVCVFSGREYTFNPQMSKGLKRTKGWSRGRSRLWDIELTATVNDDYYPVSIIDIGNTARPDSEHPTQKPADLFAYLAETYSNPGDVVLDPFLGSGTTIAAAEQTGRTCNGIELSPAYVAVALERLAGMGLDARRLD